MHSPVADEYFLIDQMKTNSFVVNVTGFQMILALLALYCVAQSHPTWQMNNLFCKTRNKNYILAVRVSFLWLNAAQMPSYTNAIPGFVISKSMMSIVCVRVDNDLSISIQYNNRATDQSHCRVLCWHWP